MTFNRASKDDRRDSVTSFGSAIIGVLIVSLGATLLAGNLGWVNAHEVLRHFWPAALILLGGMFLIQHRHRVWGVFLILGGLGTLAAQEGWIHVNFWALFGPMMLVLAGGSLVWRAVIRRRPIEESDAFVDSFAVMSGSELKPMAAFRGADLTAVMGGIKLDLTGAQLEGESATIDVFAVMGGVEIYVPRDWAVANKVISLMGACVDKRRPVTTPATKKLIVRGLALMGGIEIKD
jgi:hypothetical protein